MLDVLYPPRCALCAEDAVAPEEILLCEACRGRLDAPLVPRCRRCGVCVPEEMATEQGCPRCRGRGFVFRGVVSIGTYENELREAALRTKSSHQELLAVQLGELLWRTRRNALREFRPDVVVPIPMHWSRRISRGANSPELLADRLAQRLDIRSLTMLRRARRTKRQGGLSRAERIQNLRNAFRFRRGYSCAGAKLLLVDDIMTTGATCGEAAKVLFAAGAKDVLVAVLARAEGPD